MICWHTHSCVVCSEWILHRVFQYIETDGILWIVWYLGNLSSNPCMWDLMQKESWRYLNQCQNLIFYTFAWEPFNTYYMSKFASRHWKFVRKSPIVKTRSWLFFRQPKNTKNIKEVLWKRTIWSTTSFPKFEKTRRKIHYEQTVCDRLIIVWAMPSV